MDINELEISAWKQLIKVHLGKACLKRAMNVICDVLCVAEGIKPSLLFDYCMVGSETMKTFLTAVFSNGLLSVKPDELGILQAGEDLLVLNVAAISKILTGDVPILIDVTSCMGNPRIMETIVSHEIIEGIKNELKRQFDAASCSTNCAAAGNTAMQIHKISDSAELNLSTLFGFLLGYPVVYWFDIHVQKDNCLGMVPLTVLSLTGQFFSFNHTILSYSIPEIFVPDVNHMIDDAESNMKCTFKDCNFLSDFCFSRKTVTYPAINL